MAKDKNRGNKEIKKPKQPKKETVTVLAGPAMGTQSGFGRDPKKK